MIIVLRPETSEEQVRRVIERIEELGLKPHVSRGESRVIIGAIGAHASSFAYHFEGLDCVERVTPISKPYKLASREFKHNNTVVTVNGRAIGGKQLAIVAGPCSVESLEMVVETAMVVKEAGAHFLRGGAFKPRTCPYSFQGLGEQGLKYLKEASRRTGLPIVTEVMDVNEIDLVSEYADVLQIGARNMQNFRLLEQVGKLNKPILLKRGISATIEELLMAAEYILAQGNPNVILCERGIRTFEALTRNTLDINCIPAVRMLSHLPILVDPSHSTGVAELVPSVSRAAIAAGADGLIIEVHIHPEEALCDGAQSLTPNTFLQLMQDIRRIAAAVDRQL